MAKKRATARGYNAMLKKLAKYRRKGSKTWAKLRRKASAYRARMVAFNRHHARTQMSRFSKKQMDRLSPSVKNFLKQIAPTREGQQTQRRFRRFWKIPVPPRITYMPNGIDDMTLLVGMGFTPEVHLADSRKKNANRRVIKGRWTVATDSSGRYILLLSGRKPKPPFVEVGYAPETNYIATKDLEQAGTFKRWSHWKHKHTDAGGKYPVVLADGGGKVNAKTNFFYGRGTYSVTDWIRR